MDEGFASGLALGENRNNGGGFWDSGMGIFGIIALLAFAGGGFWGNGNNGYNNSLVGNDALISNALQTTQLEATANQRQTCLDFANTNSNITNGFSNAARDICSLGSALGSQVTRTGADIKDRLFNIVQQDADGFCNVQKQIDAANYNAAMNTAAINANTTAQVQKVLDAISGNRMAEMQNQINGLQLQNALGNVVRYPSAWTYNAGASPFCANYNCAYGNI